jgi:hypothetical protein
VFEKIIWEGVAENLRNFPQLVFGDTHHSLTVSTAPRLFLVYHQATTTRPVTLFVQSLRPTNTLFSFLELVIQVNRRVYFTSMLPPCLGYDSSNNVYRFAVTENGTTADVQKLTGTTNIEWQTVLAVNNVPASGECYFDSHSFTFGIVANLTSLDGGNGQYIQSMILYIHIDLNFRSHKCSFGLGRCIL